MIAGEPADKLISDLISNCEFLKLNVDILEVEESNIYLKRLLYTPAPNSDKERKENV